MIVESALVAAGGASYLVGRPRSGVTHVYAGPLTRTGRFVPRAGRPVCGARTRRLSVVTPPPGWSSLSAEPWSRRLCTRCSVCLQARRFVPRRVSTPQAGRPSTTRPLPTREEVRAQLQHLTRVDLWLALEFATTPDEVDVAAHASLLLFGHPACTKPVRLPSGRWARSLHAQVAETRRRVDGSRYASDRAHQQALSDALTESIETAKRERRETRARKVEALLDPMHRHVI